MLKKILLLGWISCLVAAICLGSTITSSTSTTVVTFSGFDNGKEKEVDLVGSVANVGADACVFQAIGSGNTSNSQCLGANFSITLTPQNSQTGSATWTITNTGVADITTLSLDLQPGNSVFHVCGVAGAVVSGNCGNGGGSVSSVSGGSNISATVDYSNLAQDLETQGPQPYSPLYGKITFTWAPGVFVSSDTFTFGANSDFFLSASATPEPATYGMVGLALVVIGALRMRRHSGKLKRV